MRTDSKDVQGVHAFPSLDLARGSLFQMAAHLDAVESEDYGFVSFGTAPSGILQLDLEACCH